MNGPVGTEPTPDLGSAPATDDGSFVSGTPATAYDSTPVFDADTDRIRNGSPSADEWRNIGMTDRDVSYLRSIGMRDSDLRSFYSNAASQLLQVRNPGPLQGSDPLAGTQLEGAGLAYDSQSGLAIDQATGRVFDPQSGAEVDPQTGEALDPATSGASLAPGVGDTTPGWNAQYEQAYTKLFVDSGVPEQLVPTLVQGIQAQNLNAEQLDAGLQYYGSAAGKAELAQMAQQYQAGVPTMEIVKQLAPIAAMGAVGLAGAGVVYNRGRALLQIRAESLAQRAATDPAVAAKVASAGPANVIARRAQAMGGAADAVTRSRGRVALQHLMERDGEAPRAVQGAISQQAEALLANRTQLEARAAEAGVKSIAGESSESLALRLAQKRGVNISAAGAKAFELPPAANGNTGGGAAFRPYNVPSEGPNALVQPDWKNYRAAADSEGMGLLHPKTKLRLSTQAVALGPEFTAARKVFETAGADAGIMGRLAKAPQAFGSSLKAGIMARDAGAFTQEALQAGTKATVLGGLESMGANSLKTLTGKAGIAGAVLSAGFELPGVAHTISEHGIDSKEAGNAIGGATGRVAGNLAGFAIGSSVGSVLGTAAAAAATGCLLGSEVPIVGNIAGAVVGFGVGMLASTQAGKYLGKAGEHVGDALSWVGEKTGIGTVLGKVNEISNAQEKFLDDAATKVQNVADKVTPSFLHAPVHVAIKAQEELVKVATNPLAGIKDAGNAVKHVAGAVSDGAKSVWHGIFG